MNLVLDIGNTNTKAGVFRNNKIIEKKSYNNFSLNYLNFFIKKYPAIKNLCFSNTSSKERGIFSFCKKSGIKCIEVDKNCNLPISIKYNTPKTLGPDRIAVSVGASIQYPGEKLIIDLGTCITYDFVLDSVYMGGQISPGLKIRLLGLNNYTANLPKIRFKDSDNFIGKSTEDAILIGVYDGIVYEINGIIEKYKCRYPSIKIILTGGDVEIFKKRIKSINFINPYLLMHGLNYIIATNESI